VVPALVLVPIWWRERRSPDIRPRDVATAALAFAIVGLPWYAAMTYEHGTAYLESFFVGDNLERFATDRFNEPRPWWFYVPILLGGLMPWSMYALVLGAPRAAGLVRRRGLTADEWRLVIWALAPLVFFTLSVGKQPRYILPVLPPLAILLAAGLAARIHEGGRQPALATATWVTAGLYVVLAACLLRARPLFITAYPWLTWLAVAVIAACAAALAWVAASRSWHRLPTAMTACAAALLLSAQFGALAGVRPEPVEQMAALVRAHRRAGEPVGQYQAFVRNLVFYLGFKQTELYDERRALEFLDSPGRVLLVVSADDLPRLQAISGVHVRTLGSVRYLDPASVRLRTLIAPIPEEDLDTVLLVTNR
jgi:4-amino-4-deoxy-L-arabinose transferase-like glycosyltransferase